VAKIGIKIPFHIQINCSWQLLISLEELEEEVQVEQEQQAINYAIACSST